MKSSNKIILTGIFSIIFFSTFLIPNISAQEWTYIGVDTERIPEFSVYPSEWYIYNNTYYGTMYNHSIYEVVKANISDSFMGMPNLPPFYGNFTNGTCVYLNHYLWNISSDERWCYEKEMQGVYWNGTAYLGILGAFLPIDEDTGEVSGDILSNFSYFIGSSFSRVSVTFENNATYPNSFSVQYWNTTYNNAYIRVNFTESGILNKMEGYLVSNMFNTTLYSKPAQLPPAFNFTTETGILIIDSTDFKLNITITDADNNNDGVTDTDYLFRILNGSTWTDWATSQSLLDWNLGSVPAGNYMVTMEVKNMYGVTQKQYIPPEEITDGDEIISSYPFLLMSIAAILGVSVIIYTYRKKMRV